jgi:hypothetical protein
VLPDFAAPGTARRFIASVVSAAISAGLPARSPGEKSVQPLSCVRHRPVFDISLVPPPRRAPKYSSGTTDIRFATGLFSAAPGGSVEEAPAGSANILAGRESKADIRLAAQAQGCPIKLTHPVAGFLTLVAIRCRNGLFIAFIKQMEYVGRDGASRDARARDLEKLRMPR